MLYDFLKLLSFFRPTVNNTLMVSHLLYLTEAINRLLKWLLMIESSALEHIKRLKNDLKKQKQNQFFFSIMFFNFLSCVCICHSGLE